MTTNENKAKTMTKHISCDCNANSVIQRVIQIKNGIIKHVNASAKITPHEKKIVAGILAHVFMRIASI